MCPGVNKMAERITGPFAIGGPPAGSLSQHDKIRLLSVIPAGSLAFLAATGIVGVVLAGGLFAACFSLLAPPPARMPSAVAVSIRTRPSPQPADAVAAAMSPAAMPRSAPVPLPGPAVATPPPAGTILSGGDIARAIARGDAFFRNGDPVMARFFFQLAADAGDRRAALRLGESFDPNFLAHYGERADPQAALYWYRRALDLGATDAASHLDRLDAATSR
jgi:hypothetical protein